MKSRYHYLLPVLILVLTLAAGCGGDDDNPTSPGGGNGGGTGGVKMSATVDGTAWQAFTATAINNSGVIAIGSSNASGEIGIGFGFQDAGPGTYTIGPGQIATANVISLDGTGWVANDARGSGSIVVTTLTADRIAGTFEFTAMRTVGTGNPATRVVTDGSFDLEFME